MGAFSELVVAQGPCADPAFLRMMEDLEAGYQDPDQRDILHAYGAIMRHIVQSLSTVMSMSPEQSLRHMLMSCVQQHLEHQVGLPLGSTSTPVTRYSESDSHKLADMIKLAMVAISSQYNCTVTPEGLKEALLGPDYLGLGCDLPIPTFMRRMFEVANPSLGPRSTPACQGCASPPHTPVAVNITVHQAPIAAGVQVQSVAVGRITRQHP